MKKINILLLIVGVITLTSCARGCQGFNRSLADNHKQHVNIKQYSGGKLVGEWQIYGIVNEAKGSDGYFFYDNNGELVEISGDITLTYGQNNNSKPDSISWTLINK